MTPMLCIPVLLLGSPAIAQDPEPEVVAEPVDQVRVIAFDDDGLLDGHLMLQGIVAYGGVSFTRPRGWELTADPVLDLRFEHSAALIPAESHLTVSLNDQPVGSVTLGADNVIDGRLSVRLPGSLVEDHNRIAFVVDQSYTDECEDPFEPALWTRISDQSSIRVTYRPLPIESELLQLPYPLIDDRGYGPAQVSLVGPASVSQSALQASADIGFAMGRQAAWRGVRVVSPAPSLDQVNTQAIVIGETSENGVVEELVDTTGLKTGQGLVALVPNPWNDTHGVVVLTGGDGRGVELGAEGVAGRDRRDLLSGPAAFVDEVKDAKPPPSRMHPKPAPRRSSFQLQDLGIVDTTVRGYYAPTIGIPIRFEGDARSRPGGGALKVRYAYSAQLDIRLSTVEVRLNGVSLRSVALDDPQGSEDEILEVDIPADILRPDSRLDVVFHLFPRDFDPCRYVSDKMIWGTLYDTTVIDVPLDHYTSVPNLGLLRHRAWPFNMELPQAGVVIVVPDNPTRQHASAVMQLAAELGRLSVAEDPELIVRTAGAERARPSVGHNRIALVAEEPNSWYEDQVDKGLLTARSADFTKELKTDKQLIQATVGTPYGTLEAARAVGENPFHLLVLRSPEAADLAALTRLVFDDGRVMDLSGNLAVLEPDGDIDTLDVAKKSTVGKVPVVSAARFATRRNWLLVALVATIAAVLGTAIVREWARRRAGEV